MTKILLSFCIPTYNRPERIKFILQQFTSVKNNEIEIVIGDDNPTNNGTEKIVKKFQDPRILYFRNKKNLGLDGNLLKTIYKADGDFVFINMDDDDIEIEAIAWILKKLKEERNISQIRGSIGNRRIGDNDIYYHFDNMYLKRGEESLRKLLFSYCHGSGIILRKVNLNLEHAKKYVGIQFIQELLMAQAMLKGDTICTSKRLANVGKVIYKSEHPPLFRARKHSHPVGGLLITKFRINIILDLLTGQLKEYFLNREKNHLYLWLIKTFVPFNYIESVKAFIEGLFILVTIKEFSKKISFWISLGKKLIKFLLNSPRFRISGIKPKFMSKVLVK